MSKTWRHLVTSEYIFHISHIQHSHAQSLTADAPCHHHDSEDDSNPPSCLLLVILAFIWQAQLHGLSTAATPLLIQPSAQFSGAHCTAPVFETLYSHRTQPARALGLSTLAGRQSNSWKPAPLLDPAKSWPA
jgi:hypothetical protein